MSLQIGALHRGAFSGRTSHIIYHRRYAGRPAGRIWGGPFGRSEFAHQGRARARRVTFTANEFVLVYELCNIHVLVTFRAGAGMHECMTDWYTTACRTCGGGGGQRIQT